MLVTLTDTAIFPAFKSGVFLKLPDFVEIAYMLRYSFCRAFFPVYFLLPCLFPQFAWAGGAGGDTTDSNSNPVDNYQISPTPTSETPTSTTSNSPASTSETSVAAAPNSGTSTSTTSTLEIPTTASTLTTQQTGIVQFNNSGYSNLSYPNCGGICAFGIVKLTPSNNGNVNSEAVMGVVMQFDSPEKRNAQAQQSYFKAQQNLSKAQCDRFAQQDEILLLTQLADAVEQCKDARANLLALAAAKRMRMTAEELLSRAYKQPRQCNSRNGS